MRQAILARVNEVSLKDIRKRAGEELLRIRQGETGPLERQEEVKESPTVKDMIDKFFAETAPQLAQEGRPFADTTIANYRSQSKYVRAELGSLRVAMVSRVDIDRLAAKMADKPIMRNRTLQLVSRLFAEADRWGWCSANPARLVKKGVEKERTRVLAPSEVTALHAALDDLEWTNGYAVPAIRFALWTGLRIDKEVLNLKWADVDLETGRAVLDTKTGQRVLPLVGEALRLLASLPRREGNPWAFVGAVAGSRIQLKSVSRVFEEACTVAGIQGLTLHDLRRTYITQAAKTLPPYLVSALADHKNPKTTARYVNLAATDLAKAAEQVADALTGHR